MCGLTCEGSVRTTIADSLDDARERGGASSVGCSGLRSSKSTAAGKVKPLVIRPRSCSKTDTSLTDMSERG